MKCFTCFVAGYPSGLSPWFKGHLVNQVGGVITVTLLSIGQLDSGYDWWTALAGSFFPALALICALYFLQGHTRQIGFGGQTGLYLFWTLVIKCVCVCVCTTSAKLMYSRLAWNPLFTLELALRVNESHRAFYLFFWHGSYSRIFRFQTFFLLCLFTLWVSKPLKCSTISVPPFQAQPRH